MSDTFFYGTGRRKTSTARVFLTPGSGDITVNKRPLDTFFGRKTAQMIVRQPLELTQLTEKFNVNVTVKGGGRGGRNAEFLLALALALDGRPGVHGIACDTDGIDGSEDNAGALIGPGTLARAAAQGLDAKARLADNDAYGLFQALGDLVVTGPTLTNVNDFRAILVLPEGG